MKTFDGRSIDPKAMEQIRIRAVQRVQEGESPEVVIKTLGFARACNYNWLARYRAGVRVSQSIERFLNRKLKLAVNQKKSRVAKTDDTNFLGFTFRGTKIRWSDDAFRQFKWRVKRLTGRSWFVSMEYRMKKLGQYLRGWMNYFGISEYYRPIPEIDHWLRRRVRMCYWKRWRYVRTRVRNLLKLGASPNVAVPMSFSRKGPWKCARTLATQTGMTNQWLKDQGLLSVKELWVNINYPTKIR